MSVIYIFWIFGGRGRDGEHGGKEKEFEAIVLVNKWMNMEEMVILNKKQSCMNLFIED